jgi:VWFA-related protein
MIRRSLRLPLLVLAAVAAAMPAGVRAANALSAAAAEDTAVLSVKITSPLGRMAASTNMRFVAQVRTIPDAVLRPVRFYVDGQLYKTDEDGPPYAVEWLDENPFERRELSVRVEDGEGRSASHSLVLEPFEIVDATDVNSVLLEASVHDKRGRFVAGLGEASFTVTEDGVEQEIDIVNHEALPATFLLLIDSSQSMHRRIDFVRDAARRLIDFMRPSDRMLVAPFAQRLRALTGPTADRETIADAVADIDAAGGTAILDSLIEATGLLPASETRRVIVLVTDGYDERSVTRLDDAVAALKAAQVTVYVVGIGGSAGISLKGERLLRQVAAATGGQTFFPPREEELVKVHEQLAVDAQNRYLVTYTPKNQEKDGAWRAVSLTAGADYVVRTRTGYRAPAPPPIRPELEFTLTDEQRGYVDISADDLLVLEDGVEQKIEAFHEAVAPVSIVLALDSSGSMRASASAVMEAAREFVTALRPEDSLALVLFADQSLVVHDFTKDRAVTLKAIEGYRASGGTALYDALWDAVTKLQRVEGRRAVVVLSDGRDENNPGTAPGSVRTAQDVFEALPRNEAAIFTIGLGPTVDRPFLERLADASGGESYFPAEVAGLRGDYQRVVENLRRRYVVSYTSTNTTRNGQWRGVEIRPRTPGLRVRGARGYFAPER